MAGIGPEGVDVLVRGLQKSNHPLDRLYRKVYRRMPALSGHVLPAPREDFTRPTRMTLCALLAQLSPDDMAATPMMTAELRDEDPAVRTLAITFFTYGENQDALLNKLDKEKKQSLLPFFIADMRDPTVSVRNNATVALGYYPEEATAIVSILVQALKDPDAHVAKVAANSLKKIDPVAAAQAGVK
jgi:hypothetical protein